MSTFSRLFPTVHSDAPGPSGIVNTVRSAVSIPESELKRWRRIFDANATITVDGKKFVNTFSELYFKCWLTNRENEDRYLDSDSFVNAVAPIGDLSKIHRAQFAILFRVADTSRRGLVSWEDFTVFETLLKRPDADYWIAFL